MHKGLVAAAVLGLGLFTAGTARAEEPESPLWCERFVDGSAVAHVYSYPTYVLVDTYVYNDSETETFTVTSIFDWPQRSEPRPVNITVGPGSSIGGTNNFQLQSYEHCAALADREQRAQTGQPIFLRTFAEVLTATGEKAKCMARVVCH